MAPETRGMKTQPRLCGLEWMIGPKKWVRTKVLRERKGVGSKKRDTPQRRTSGMERAECKWIKKRKGEEEACAGQSWK